MLFYTFGTEDEYNVMIKISRIVENLKFENEEAGKLFRESFITESMEYLRAVFGELVAAGKLKPGDYEAAAFQITSFANMIYVLNLLNGSKREDFNKKYNDGIAFLTKVLFELR